MGAVGRAHGWRRGVVKAIMPRRSVPPVPSIRRKLRHKREVWPRAPQYLHKQDRDHDDRQKEHEAAQSGEGHAAEADRANRNRRAAPWRDRAASTGCTASAVRAPSAARSGSAGECAQRRPRGEKQGQRTRCCHFGASFDHREHRIRVQRGSDRNLVPLAERPGRWKRPPGPPVPPVGPVGRARRRGSSAGRRRSSAARTCRGRGRRHPDR